MTVFLVNGTFVFLGSALGAVARHWLSGWVDRRIGEAFPWGTFVVNVSGCFALGLLAGATENGSHLPDAVRPFLAVGFLGGYTTVSSFSLQTLELLREGQTAAAAANIALSTLTCLTGVALGLASGVTVPTP